MDICKTVDDQTSTEAKCRSQLGCRLGNVVECTKHADGGCGADGSSRCSIAASVSALDYAALWEANPHYLGLSRDTLSSFIRRKLSTGALCQSYTGLEAGRCWIIYWLLHALELLDLGQGDLELLPSTVEHNCEPSSSARGEGALQHSDACANASADAGGGGVATAAGPSAVSGSGTATDKCAEGEVSPASDDIASRVVIFFKAAQWRSGGFGGGPGQFPHVVTTYAAVAALAILKRPEALYFIDREKMYGYLMSMRTLDAEDRFAGFRVHDGGEVDVRGCYCAVATAVMLKIVTPELTEGVVDYVCRLQSWDGGMAGAPGTESHAAYGYCALATLGLLKDFGFIDTRRLISWAVSRQMTVEGGFNGRPNKLVDSCYTFWVASTLLIARDAIAAAGTKPPDHLWVHAIALHTYVLGCCQEIVKSERQSEFNVEDLCPLPGGHPMYPPATDEVAAVEEEQHEVDEQFGTTGLLRDKPGKPADFYHTCYSLSGLSLVQQGHEVLSMGRVAALADASLLPTDPLLNLRLDTVRFLQHMQYP